MAKKTLNTSGATQKALDGKKMRVVRFEPIEYNVAALDGDYKHANFGKHNPNFRDEYNKKFNVKPKDDAGL